ncbi:hypothetical protein SAMN04487957_11247 [Halomonas shengliensis]|uniref:Uncharacterized protein n=1 Tax=Halomonas shengliensis TaxID=419597 RepID=A0A1H0MHQ9_9GAMM|nr:hypothetical protein [Halomonas shengliensis]SDO79901.1 hypothetical protein SAMN04487957_11247 [Halomonas shengliensis]
MATRLLRAWLLLALALPLLAGGTAAATAEAPAARRPPGSRHPVVLLA